MCQGETPPRDATTPHDEPFPWDEGVFDAHCHPTDTMTSVSCIPQMRARCLTVMATRSQDQHLVAQVADTLSISSPAALSAPADDARLVPAFGWHPWFSHQLYDDALPEPSYRPASSSPEDIQAAKKAHYQAVLAPPPDDQAFIDSLPTPAPLSSFVDASRDHLAKYPLALVGEIGLDKAFRLPRQWDPDEAASRDETLTPGGREGRLLSPQRVSMPHQQAVLRAQLALAAEMGRAVSLHGVQAHGILLETVSASWKGMEIRRATRREKRQVAPGAEDSDSESEGDTAGQKGRLGRKPFPPRICLHSFSGSVELLKQWLNPAIPSKIFVSFSTVINLATEAGKAKFDDIARAVPENRILVESDLHTAGDDMDGYLEDMYRRVCQARGWELREGVARIRKNYEEFIFG
ncbi:hypothetical protein B0I35DRAFT_345440 [Stachybotrys elegans]|uniref:Uncharacterized protein n=1 Tax=Stachybotrys elegans TaxID=80388 RepID=A0A8K0T6F6_9HYPO|nr:hypothetical protein B0I35DRAFT_345440 [Stachybotrys elegans]